MFPIATSARRGRQVAEDGGVAVVVAMLAVVLAALMFVVLHAGRLLIARQDALNSADALALAGAALLRERGGAAGDALDLRGVDERVRAGNSAIPFAHDLVVLRDVEQARAVVRARVEADYLTPWARWFGGGALKVRATAHAEVAEWGFRQRWPAVVIVLDASGSMGMPFTPGVHGHGGHTFYGAAVEVGGRCNPGRPGHCGGDNLYCNAADRRCAVCPIDRFNCDGVQDCESSTRCAPRTLYDLLTRLVEAYAERPFPVRNGLVVFNKRVVARVVPPAANVSNIGAIRAALRGVTPASTTDIGVALQEAARMVGEAQDSAILITDGDPTAGGSFLGFLPWFDSHADKARQGAAMVRGRPASVFSVETRPQHARMSELLVELAGAAGSAGNDRNFYYALQLVEDIAAFLEAMAWRVCAFGPLPDSAGRDVSETTHAFLREVDGEEEPLRRISLDELRRSTAEDVFAYEQTGSGGLVHLSQPTCYRLARQEGRALVVRHGGVRLTMPPGARTVLDFW